MQPKVFIPHLPTRQNPLDGSWSPTISLAPAAELGELVVICEDPISAAPTQFENSADRIRSEVATNYGQGDFVLMAGDPVLCAVAIHEALESVDCVKVLRWNREQRKYDVIKINRS